MAPADGGQQAKKQAAKKEPPLAAVFKNMGSGVTICAVVGAIVATLIGIIVMIAASGLVQHYYYNYYTPAREERLYSYMHGALITASLRASLDLGIFDMLEQNPSTAQEVAEAKKLDAGATHALLEALALNDLVSLGSNGKYALTKTSSEHLVRNKVGFLGPLFELVSSRPVTLGYMSLEEAVKAGGSPQANETNEFYDRPFWDHYYSQAFYRGVDPGQALPLLLSQTFPVNESVTVLDVAGGVGSYGFGYAKVHPKAVVTLLVPAEFRRHAEQQMERVEAAIASRVSFREGALLALADAPEGAEEPELGSGYDVVVVAHAVHLSDGPRNRRLLRRLAARLRPGGLLVAYAFVRDESPAGYQDRNPFARLLELSLRAWTRSGRTFTRPELDAILHDAGLEPPTAIPDIHSPASWLIARKPSQ
eukprot:tig00000808_g4414.t1